MKTFQFSFIASQLCITNALLTAGLLKDKVGGVASLVVAFLIIIYGLFTE